MRHPSRYIPRALLLAVLALLVVGVGAATAAAATAKSKHKPPCWKTLINDWYDGRIDGTYPIHCYREALNHLPTDVDTYSSARDDIKQALRERITQGRKGGGANGAGGPGGSNGNGGGGKKGGGGKSTSGPIKQLFDTTKPGSADSVPVPLIVLGGVALLLMAAGGAGFLARRTRARKLQLATAASVPQASTKPPRPER